MEEINLSAVRQDTPGCRNVLHFNNAGASLMPRPVVEAVIKHLRLEEEVGGYEAAELARESVESCYEAAASLLGCQGDEIAFAESATRAWDMAVYSLDFKADDRILTGVPEYGSNYIALLQVARNTGAVVEVVPNDEHGQTSVSAMREMLDERVKLVAITHVPSNGGLVNPAAEIGKVAREAGALYMLDACQSVGQMPVNVDELGCDMLSVTGRKYLRGPRGTGFLYVKREVLEGMEPAFLDLYAAEYAGENLYRVRPGAQRFESWESNYAAKIGLGVAIGYALRLGLEGIRRRVSSLAAELRARLSRLPGVVVRDQGEVRCGIVTFTCEGVDPQTLRLELLRRRINVSVSGPQSAPLDMSARALDGLLRASVHYYNSDEEVERFCDELKSILR